VVKKEFLKSSIVYTVSSTLSTAASFILLPFYTNTSLLAVADFGALSLYIGLSLLVQVFASFSLDYYVVVAYHELKDKPDEQREKIASLNGYLLAMGGIIVLLFALGGDLFIKHYLDNPHPAAFRYVMMSVFTGVFNAHFKFYNNLLIHREKPERYFWSNILNFISTVVFTIVILKWYPLTLEGPIWGRFLSCLSIFLLSFTEMTTTYGLRLDKKFVKPALTFCLPLMITAIFQWVLSYSDRYIIKPLLFNKEVAIFDLAARFTLLVSFLLDGLTSAISPKIFGLFKDIDNEAAQKEINKYYSGFNIVMLVLIPLNILVLPVVLPLFISNEKYLTAFLYFGIICAGFVTRSLQNVFIFPIHYFKKTSRLIFINGIAAVVQVALGYLMVRQYKLYGAAVTLNIVKVFLMVLYFFFCRDLLSKKMNIRKMVWLPLAVLFIITIPDLFIKEYGLQMHLVHFAESIAVMLLTYIVYSNEISELLVWAKKLLAQTNIPGLKR
jgi:O-antigen/teichoic acid export membrane protein